jgi:hypothetical protein
MNRLSQHLRSNLVAYIALFVALGGTSYALELPNGSVGEKQIKNHAIDPVKFNQRFIAGSIRAWVIVQWRGGKLVAQAASGPVRVVAGSTGESITWPNRRFSTNCSLSATPQINVGSSLGFDGTVTSEFAPMAGAGAFVQIFGFGPDGAKRPQAVDVMVVCP